MALHIIEDGRGADNIERVRHGRIEFARLEGAVADTVEHRAEAESIEQAPQSVGILGILSDDARPAQPPSSHRPNADDLAGIFAMEIMERVVPGNAGDAG